MNTVATVLQLVREQTGLPVPDQATGLRERIAAESDAAHAEFPDLPLPGVDMRAWYEESLARLIGENAAMQMGLEDRDREIAFLRRQLDAERAMMGEF